MSFEQFAQQHGLIIDHLLLDKWVRCPTTDKPNSRNGAYFYDGKGGAVQNWALHEKPLPFKVGNQIVTSGWSIRSGAHKEERAKGNFEAIRKAANILNNAHRSGHPYLKSKGFPEIDNQLVWNGVLIVPMRIDQKLVGLQMINQKGGKHFLRGQVTKNAECIIDAKGADILCEGYATGLSIRRALKAIGVRYTIHICFSAGNLKNMAKKYPDCVIVADHDPVGMKVAKETGRPFWVSPNLGEDFNDYELRVGTEKAGRSLIALDLSVAHE